MDSSHDQFVKSNKKHILQITNHGIHQWDIIPGLPDTGGQNIYVDKMTQALVDLGYKVTIVNRGGYAHPITGEHRVGIHYKDENQRIVYIEDSKKEFVRKEDMHEHFDELSEYLYEFIKDNKMEIDLMFTHFWDAAKLGVLLNQKYQKDNEQKVPHYFVPHELGEMKQRNVKPEDLEGLRNEERIDVEREIMKEIDGFVSTSALVKESFMNDYDIDTDLFLPPCIDTNRYRRINVKDDSEIWKVLSEKSGLTPKEVKERKRIMEISRTDDTKKKDVLIRAFAKVHKKNEQTMLIISLDSTEEGLFKELNDLISELKIEDSVAVVGNVWHILPELYSITDIYCSASVMEGFGMAVQEAAATQVPVIGSDLIPFVTEYLVGEDTEEVKKDGSKFILGEGAIIVKANDVDGFTAAINLLLEDEELRNKMGQKAFDITIPYFTWKGMTKKLLIDIGEEFSKTSTETQDAFQQA